MKKVGKKKNVYARIILGKLPSIQGDLLPLDDHWQKWEFGQFLEAMRK